MGQTKSWWDTLRPAFVLCGNLSRIRVREFVMTMKLSAGNRVRRRHNLRFFITQHGKKFSSAKKRKKESAGSCQAFWYGQKTAFVGLSFQQLFLCSTH